MKKPIETTGAIEATLAPLYQIAGEYLALLEEITTAAEENDGIIPEHLNDRWNTIEGNFDAKCANCEIVLGQIERQTDAVSEEIKRLQAVKKRLAKSDASLREYVLRQMEATGKESGGIPEHALRVATNPPGVDPKSVDVDKIPDEFCDYEITVPADQWASVLYAIGEAKRFAEEIPSEARNDDEDDVLQLRPERWKAKRKERRSDIVTAWKKKSGAEDIRGAKVRQLRVVKRA